MKRPTTHHYLALLGCSLSLLSSAVIAATPVDLSHQSVSRLQAWLPSASGLAASDTKVVETSRDVDFNGTLHVRFDQSYQGVPVYNSGAVMHVKHGNASQSLAGLSTDKRQSANTTMNGLVYDQLQKDLGKKPVVSPSADMLQKVIASHVKEIAYAVDVRDPQAALTIFVDDRQVAHWAYHIIFDIQPKEDVKELPKRINSIIDAQTNVAYVTWDDIQTVGLGLADGGGFGGNVKMGKMSYDGLTVKNDTVRHLSSFKVGRNETSNTCHWKNKDVTVLHYSTRKTMKFPCKVQDPDHNSIYWSGERDNANGGYSPANDAMFGGMVIKNMYKEWYNVPVLKIKGKDGKDKAMMLTMVVHWKDDNAYWDGKVMTFGDGVRKFYPLTSLGVAAHEISHGFTQQNSGLAYYSQSGGMNEAFSDMAAQGAEYYAYGTNSFQIGPEIFKEDRALRYMDQPSKDCAWRPRGYCSIDHVKDYTSSLDVHYSSGIYNRLFYLIATSSDWNTRKAFDVMVKANRNYWTRMSTFNSGACGVLSAAKDYGYDDTAIRTAMTTVGIDFSACKLTPPNKS